MTTLQGSMGNIKQHLKKLTAEIAEIAEKG